MAIWTYTCPRCQDTVVGKLLTDGAGNLVEQRPPCRCERGESARPAQPDELSYEERAAIARKTGVCMDCDAPVEGRRGWALRCAEHKRRVAYDRSNEARRTAEGRKKRRKYERRARRSKAAREKRSARRRELHAERMANDPEYRERYRRRRQRENSIQHPSYARRIAYQRRANADPERAERKRQLAREAYYRANPVRPDPHCTTCGERIGYDGKGAPPKYHPTRDCNPYWSSRDERAA